jgi:hypothetical protein
VLVLNEFLWFWSMVCPYAGSKNNNVNYPPIFLSTLLKNEK